MVLANIQLGGRKGSNHQWNTHYTPSIWHLLSHLILKQMWWLPFNRQGIYNPLRFSRVASVRGGARISTHNFNSVCSAAHQVMSSSFLQSYYKTWLKVTAISFSHVSAVAPDALFWPQLIEEVGRQVSRWLCSNLSGFLHSSSVCRLEFTMLYYELNKFGESNARNRR